MEPPVSDPVREAALDKIARVIVGIPWSQAMAELDNDELPGGSAFALAAFRDLLAERDRAVKELERLADEAEAYLNLERDGEQNYPDSLRLNIAAARRAALAGDEA